MKAVNFPQANVQIAESQEQYNTLPAYVSGENGEVTVCFELDEDELKQVQETGRIWLSFLTFNNPLQPIFGSCLEPYFKEGE